VRSLQLLKTATDFWRLSKTVISGHKPHFFFDSGMFFLQNFWFFQGFEMTWIDGSLTLIFFLKHPNLWFSVSKKL
jgi:hypothetical protein